jgi:hypothetical protein
MPAKTPQHIDLITFIVDSVQITSNVTPSLNGASTILNLKEYLAMAKDFDTDQTDEHFIDLGEVSALTEGHVGPAPDGTNISGNPADE